jgi:hypothetical protein
MNVIRPIVGQWYRGGTNELFEVVAIDDQDQTIEIQYFDGTVTEVDFDLVGRRGCGSRRLGSRVRGQRAQPLVHSVRSIAAPLTLSISADPADLRCLKR